MNEQWFDALTLANPNTPSSELGRSVCVMSTFTSRCQSVGQSTPSPLPVSSLLSTAHWTVIEFLTILKIVQMDPRSAADQRNSRNSEFTVHLSIFRIVDRTSYKLSYKYDNYHTFGNTVSTPGALHDVIMILRPLSLRSLHIASPSKLASYRETA